MTRSIFDPTGQPEHSGSRNMGPKADDLSQLPPRFNQEHEEDDDADDAGTEQEAAAEGNDIEMPPAGSVNEEELDKSDLPDDMKPFGETPA